MLRKYSGHMYEMLRKYEGCTKGIIRKRDYIQRHTNTYE